MNEVPEADKMSDLQDALDRHDEDRYTVRERYRLDRDMFVDAARRVANPDYKAAHKLLVRWGVATEGTVDGSRARNIVDAALGIEDTSMTGTYGPGTGPSAYGGPNRGITEDTDGRPHP